MSDSHRWWAVDCETTDCETKLLLAYIGPNPYMSKPVYHFHMVPLCAPFKETCPECKLECQYQRNDVHEVTFDAPPAGYQASPAFLKAIQPPQPEKQAMT
jgi:hypothetical protein